MAQQKMAKVTVETFGVDYPEPESIVAVLKRKKKVQEIPVIMRARAGGVSSISPLNSIYYMVKVTIAILIERIR